MSGFEMYEHLKGSLTFTEQAWKDRAEALKAENERLRAVARDFARYADHDDTCPTLEWPTASGKHNPCECGLDQATERYYAALSAPEGTEP